VKVGRRAEIGIVGPRLVGVGEDGRTLSPFETSDGEVARILVTIRAGLGSGDSRRRYLRTGSFDFFVGDEPGVFNLWRIGVFEGVVGAVVGVTGSAKIVSLPRGVVDSSLICPRTSRALRRDFYKESTCP
jgi:hypothetical protein